MSKKSPKVKASPAEVAQAQISQDLFKETSPLRQALLQAGTGPATQGFSTSILPSTRDTLESQFGRARESILQSTPARGGQLNALLAQNAMERAGTLTRESDIASQRGIENALNVLAPAALPGANQVLGTLGQAAQMGASRNQMNAQMAAQQQQALFGGLGKMAGLFFGGGSTWGSNKPWIFGG